MKLLITGGSGQVGKELKLLYPNAFNISSSDCNLLDKNKANQLIRDLKPDIVIHAAAKVGGITDNITNQYAYYTENTLINTNLISECVEFGVKKFIGMLSTCAYPDVSDRYPMTESMLFDGKPALSNFSYAIAKRGMAAQIDSIKSNFNYRYCYLIPSNLYGPNEKYSNKSHFIGGIFSKILKAKLDNSKEIVLLGSGKALRQLLFARDLALAIKEMIDNDVYENFNIANPSNLSIDEYARFILNVIELNDWKILYDESKPDGQFRKDVDISRFLTKFPTFKFTELESGIRQVAQKLGL